MWTNTGVLHVAQEPWLWWTCISGGQAPCLSPSCSKTQHCRVTGFGVWHTQADMPSAILFWGHLGQINLSQLRFVVCKMGAPALPTPNRVTSRGSGTLHRARALGVLGKQCKNQYPFTNTTTTIFYSAESFRISPNS